MRLIGWLIVCLMVVGWFASEIPVEGTPATGQSPGDWRRTNGGWERMTGWMLDGRIRRPALHPTTVALLEMSLALAALAAFSAAEGRPRRNAKPAGPHGQLRNSATGPYRFVVTAHRSYPSHRSGDWSERE